jgi:hypothetical protein
MVLDGAGCCARMVLTASVSGCPRQDQEKLENKALCALRLFLVLVPRKSQRKGRDSKEQSRSSEGTELDRGEGGELARMQLW